MKTDFHDYYFIKDGDETPIYINIDLQKWRLII